MQNHFASNSILKFKSKFYAQETPIYRRVILQNKPQTLTITQACGASFSKFSAFKFSQR